MTIQPTFCLRFITMSPAEIRCSAGGAFILAALLSFSLTTERKLMREDTLPRITLAAPLVGIDVVAAALDKTTKQVSLMIAHRELGPAWDVSLGEDRMAIRILAREVERFQSGAKSQLLKPNASFAGFIF